MNVKKKSLLTDLVEYFIKQGEVLSYDEYKAKRDVPIRPVLIKRNLGSWSRVLRLVEMNFPEEWAILQEPKEEAKVYFKSRDPKEEPSKEEESESSDESLVEGEKDENKDE